MSKQCLYDKKHSCSIWTDYLVLQHSLQEADELSHQNWNEIQSLHNRVCLLEIFILEHGMTLPEDRD